MTSFILFEEKNHLGVVTLNRPEALNAITGDMFTALQIHLKKWQENRAIQAILIKSNCEKAFCAGGDIRLVYLHHNEDPEKSACYFRLEYDINRCIFHYPKPIISFLHGIAMGGGLGISIHGSHPIGSETLRLAMPETKIGFFPDVGMSYHLSRLPHCIGIYLALTGNMITLADAIELRLIKHFVPTENVTALENKLIDADLSDKNHVTDIIRTFSKNINASDLLKYQQHIADCFSYSTVEEMISALQNKQDNWCHDIANQLLQRSPTSLKVTLEQLKRAKSAPFDKVIETDFHIAKTMLIGHDFFEGIRAAVIDKDHRPKWNPGTLQEATKEMVLTYFD